MPRQPENGTTSPCMQGGYFVQSTTPTMARMIMIVRPIFHGVPANRMGGSTVLCPGVVHCQIALALPFLCQLPLVFVD